MVSAVLDTNVLASGILSAETPPGQLIDAWHAGLFRLVISEQIITELKRTLSKSYFSRRLTDSRIADAIALLREGAAVTPITSSVSAVATHPEDDLVLATSVSGKADYLVTGDKQLQQLGRFEGVTILSPTDFLHSLVTSYGKAA